MRKVFTIFSVLSLCSGAVFAADNTHGEYYGWGQVNMLYTVDGLPGDLDYDTVELEFGGRSGILDFYGYVDIFNVASNDSSDIASASSRTFIQLTPRLSINGLTGKDLSFGPVEELYVAADFTWDGASYSVDEYSVNEQKVGLGSDMAVPWLGKIGLNLFATYDSNHKDWNGYQISTNWFKPLYFFDNGSFIAYQGYLDYQFDLKSKYSSSNHGGTMYNGIYWHTDRYSIGYGLQGSSNIYGIKDSSYYKSSGFSHYFVVTYKL